jgi:hypothetical protein
MKTAPARDRVAALRKELDEIHLANTLYWEKGSVQSREARAEYQRRLDRLEEIRTELAQFQSG